MYSLCDIVLQCFFFFKIHSCLFVERSIVRIIYKKINKKRMLKKKTKTLKKSSFHEHPCVWLHTYVARALMRSSFPPHLIVKSSKCKMQNRLLAACNF